MEFTYKNLKGKFIDFQVVETGFYFTWIKLQYELYNEHGEVIDKDWSTHQYGTFGYEPEFDDEYYDEDGEVKLTDEEIVNYVDDLFHDIYEIEDLVDGIRRSSYANFWDPVESVEDICKELFEFLYFQYPQYLESQK